jgi:hypothetical protein
MFSNGVVLQRFGVSWTVARCCIVIGVALVALSGVLFSVLFKHMKGKARRLEPEEASRVAFYGRSTASPGVDEVVQGRAVGVGVEIKFGIDDLRLAARRGDWMTFWLSPLLITTFILGLTSLITAGLVAASAPGLIVAVAYIPLGLMLLIFWFMPWAAIYTNIDAGTARGPQTSAPATASPIGGSRKIEERR